MNSFNLLSRLPPIMSLLALTLLLSGCALNYRNLEPPTVELVGVRAAGLESDLSLGVIAYLRLDNPNDRKLPVEGGQVAVSLNGQPIADGTLADGFELPALGSTDVELPIRVDLTQAIALGLTVINDAGRPIDWNLNGHVDVGVRYLGRVYFDETGQLQL